MIEKIQSSKLLALLCILTVPIYTVLFGIRKDPSIYTLSKIGNYFTFKTDFVIWGILTGLLLAFYVLHIFRKADYENKMAKRFLFLSYVFLIITVLVPNFQGTIEFYIHVTASLLFGACLLVSIILFIRHLYLKKNNIFSKSLWFLIISMILPVILLFIYQKPNGVLEIAFFISISASLIAMNVYLSTHKKEIQKAS